MPCDAPNCSRCAFEDKFYQAVSAAEAHMALADIPDEASDDKRFDAYEERYHCEVCLVNNVLDIVMKPVMAYIEALEEAVTDTSVATPEQSHHES